MVILSEAKNLRPYSRFFASLRMTTSQQDFPQRELCMNDPAEKRGGIVGAGILALATLMSFLAFYLGEGTAILEPVRYVLIPCAYSTVLLGIVGYIAGRCGAKCLQTPRAFLSGGLLLGIASGVGFSAFYIFAINPELTMYYWSLALPLMVIFFGSGSLISGFGAIVGRDYNKFQKLRFIPQFTLQELLIVISLFTVITSAIASIPIVL